MSSHPSRYAQQIITDNSAHAEPLLKLLFIAMEARGDPLSEAELNETIKMLYAETPHSQAGLEAFRNGDEVLSLIAS